MREILVIVALDERNWGFTPYSFYFYMFTKFLTIVFQVLKNRTRNKVGSLLTPNTEEEAHASLGRPISGTSLPVTQGPPSRPEEANMPSKIELYSPPIHRIQR